jgi:hypothetical protein
VARPPAQSRAPIAGLQYLVALLTFVAGSAQAGAWTPARGDTSVIISTSISETPVAPQATTTDLYYERGLGKGWALVLAPSLSDRDNIYARNEAQISIRRALYEQNGWAVSAQAGAYIWKEGATQETSSGIEYRLAVGKSLGDRAWLNGEAATRACNGTPSVRWETTAGYRLRDHDRAIFKVFGDGEGCAPSISRVQASYVYGLSERIGVELGWRETLPNASNWNERGGVVGLWLKF